MSSSTLKIIACLTMLIDHVGAILFPEMIIFRIIGRIAFPIFAFLIVEGYFHTKDVKKYLIRLAIFAFVAEVPFDLAFQHTVFSLKGQNVFFTLFFGLLAIYLNEKFKESRLGTGFFVVLFSLINTVIMADYVFFGIMIIFIFYHYRGKKREVFIGLLGVNLLMSGLMTVMNGHISYWSVIGFFELVSLSMIYYYNGKKGIGLKYLFYIFYPGHLLILTAIANYWNKS